MGSATVSIARGFYAESESQYVRVAETATTVFKIGALYAGARGVTLQTAYYVVQAGLGRGHSVLSRGGLRPGPFGVVGGGAPPAAAAPPVRGPAAGVRPPPSHPAFGRRARGTDAPPAT